MKRIYLIIFLSIFAISAVTAQESPLHGQYLQNYYYLNPAVGGSMKTSPLRLIIYQQWKGFSESPTTSAISYHQRVPVSPARNVYTVASHGFGGTIFSQKRGALKQTGVQVSYAYHIPMKSFQLSLGLAVTAGQFSVDAEKLNFNEPGDPVIADEALLSKLIPDADFGVYIYSVDESAKKYWAGLSANQLVRSIATFDDYGVVDNRLAREVNVSGGYQFIKKSFMAVEASGLASIRLTTPEMEKELHVSLKTTFNRLAKTFDEENVSLLVSYWKDRAVTAAVIFELNNVYLSYSPTFWTINASNFTGLTHQIMIGLNVEKRRR